MLESTNRLAAEGAFIDRPMVVHVGYPRTGSSFLQDYVFDAHPDCAMLQFERDAIAHHEAKDPRLLFLTNESYAGWVDRDMPEEAAILRAKFPQARIMLMLRSQFRMFRSYYYLYVKGGGTLGYADYVRAYAGKVLNYRALYQAYADAFGAERINVYLHEELVADMRGTVRRMLADFGLETGIAETVENVTVKPSSDDAVLALLRLLNRIHALFTGGGRDAAERRDAPLVLPGIGRLARIFGWLAPKIDAAPVEGLIRETYGADNDALFAALGRDAAGYPSAAAAGGV
jgi:hypothetical protein